MRIALLQTDIAWEDREATLARVGPWLDRAQGAGARLALLPEMFACGFSMRLDRVAEAPEGPTTTFLRERAAALDLWIGGTVPERAPRAARAANTFLLAGPRGELLRYRKLHPFTFAREHEHYAPGDAICRWEIEGVRLTPFVCYDLRFANVFWEVASTTDAYLVVANWPEARRAHWRALLRARAIENQAYVIAVNRVGRGGELVYAGDSVALDPWGEALAEGAREETMLLAEVDPARVADARERFPAMADRRTHVGLADAERVGDACGRGVIGSA